MVNFKNTNFQGTYLSNASIEYSGFSGAILKGVNFSCKKLIGLNLIQTNINNSDFLNSTRAV
jgi:uncharacterized protein YjbI with pentapeptide repeats